MMIQFKVWITKVLTKTVKYQPRHSQLSLTSIFAPLNGRAVGASDLCRFGSFGALDNNKLDILTISYAAQVLARIVLDDCGLERREREDTVRAEQGAT